MNPRRAAGADRPALLLGAGLLVFAAGAALALSFLPEWSPAGTVREERFFRTQYRRLASRAGFHLVAGEPRVSLVAGFSRPPGQEPRAVLRAQASHLVRHAGEVQSPRLDVSFSPDGKPVKIAWEDYSVPILSLPEAGRDERLVRDLVPLLLAPGESTGESRQGGGLGRASWRLIDLAGSSPGEHLYIEINPPVGVSLERLPGRLAEVPGVPEKDTGKKLFLALIWVLVGLAVAGVFLSLLLRGRIDLANGAILGLIALLSANPFRLFDLQAGPG